MWENLNFFWIECHPSASWTAQTAQQWCGLPYPYSTLGLPSPSIQLTIMQTVAKLKLPARPGLCMIVRFFTCWTTFVSHTICTPVSWCCAERSCPSAALVSPYPVYCPCIHQSCHSCISENSTHFFTPHSAGVPTPVAHVNSACKAFWWGNCAVGQTGQDHVKGVALCDTLCNESICPRPKNWVLKCIIHTYSYGRACPVKQQSQGSEQRYLTQVPPGQYAQPSHGHWTTSRQFGHPTRTFCLPRWWLWWELKSILIFLCEESQCTWQSLHQALEGGYGLNHLFQVFSTSLSHYCCWQIYLPRLVSFQSSCLGSCTRAYQVYLQPLHTLLHPGHILCKTANEFVGPGLCTACSRWYGISCHVSSSPTFPDLDVHTKTSVDTFWSISLVFSMAAASDAKLVSGWICDYMNLYKKHDDQPLNCSHVWQFLNEDQIKWYMQLVVHAIPISMLISIILVIIRFTISLATATATTLFIAIFATFYVLCTIAPIYEAQAPYQTSLSRTFWFSSKPFTAGLTRTSGPTWQMAMCNYPWTNLTIARNGTHMQSCYITVEMFTWRGLSRYWDTE